MAMIRWLACSASVSRTKTGPSSTASFHQNRAPPQKLMRISFDIDDTLVWRETAMPREAGLLPTPIHQWLTEPLRRGTRTLFRQLHQHGCSIWIYTSSLRTPFHIWLWLRLHGIRIDGIVNDDRHRRELSRCNFAPPLSKYPPAFGIDLHIDDSKGVWLEGKNYGFQVLVISPDDEGWADKVLDAVAQARQTIRTKQPVEKITL
jgi:hypothetical protein